MKTIFHAMDKKTLEQFIESKKELLSVASALTAKEREDGRKEIMEAAVIYEVPSDLDDHRELYSVSADGSAVIPISGKLTPQVDVCDGFFSDCTTYGFIQAATVAADNDPLVSEIKYHVSSGGGYVTGVDACGQTIASANKKTTAVVSGMAASAAYWLASQCDNITMSSPTDFVGSIGVAVEFVDTRKADESRGIKRIVLTSTDAPDKRLDLTTDEGQAKEIEELDAIHVVFASRVSTGRKVNIDKINSDFGKGGLVIASQAKKVGMVDSIENEIISTPTPASAGPQKQEATQMGLKALLAADPAAQAEYDADITAAQSTAKAEGVTEGKAQGVEETKAVYAIAMPIISSAHYPEALKKRVMEKAQSGDSDAVNDFVALYDMTAEGIATAAAIAQSEEDGETPAAGPETTAEKDMASFEAKKNRTGGA